MRDKDKDKKSFKISTGESNCNSSPTIWFSTAVKIRNLKDSCHRRGKRVDILKGLAISFGKFTLLVDYPSINMPSLKFLHGWITRLHFVVQRILSNGSEALCHIHPRHYWNPTIKYQLKRFWTFYSAAHFRKLAQSSVF